MKKAPELRENDIELLLQMDNINREEKIDMYFQIIDYQLLNRENNLYICTLKDKNSTYNKFIIKSSKEFLIDSIIHVTKIRITISGNNRIISCLNYENFGKINFEELKQKQEEKEKKREEELCGLELNEETKQLISNLQHKKRKKKYFFKYNKGDLKISDIKTNQKVDLPPYSGHKRENMDELANLEKKSNEIKNDIDNEIKNNLDNGIKNNLNEEKNNLDNNEVKKDDDEESEYDDKEEVKNLFEGVNVDEIFKINEKRDKRRINLDKDLQLIVNLSEFEEGKPLYIKCINKQMNINQNQKYLVYIFRDQEGKEINAYVYGSQDTIIFNRKIVKNGVYLISNYLIKTKISSAFINSDYRLILTSNTQVQIKPPDPIFNEIHFHLLNIGDLFYFKEGTIIDICGIIYNEGKSEITKTKHGNRITRNILLCDNSMKKINITLWEPHSNNIKIKFEKGEILAIKYCKLFLYPEKTKKLSTIYLSILQNSTSDYEKDLLLKNFYKNHQNINDFGYVINPPDYKYLEEIKNQIIYNKNNKISNCKMLFSTKAYIDDISLDDQCIFNGCPFCHRKLNEFDDSHKDINIPDTIKFKCIFCKKNFEKPKYVFKLSFRVRDATSKVYFNMIGEEAKKFVDVEPDIIKEYLEEKNFSQLKKIEEKLFFKEYIFMGKLESYQSRGGNIVNNIKIHNCEKAEGENLKRIINLIEDED